MKAAVLREVAKPLQIENVAISKEEAYPYPLPAVLGHESSGVVEQVGSEVRTVRPGDHVVTCLSAFCGHCNHGLTGRACA